MASINNDEVDIAPLPSAIQQSSLPIKRLSKDVVDRIAAGEIIHKPSSALKEMLENSVDAGSTSVSVSCKDGGIKLLQVTDNGKGIRKSDLGIVCERHTTSKIQKFEDLTTVTTYGFRGEALASISMVANVTIITKTEDADCAYKTTYEDSKIVNVPQPCAGVKGTTIMVKDLFYNVPTRLRTLKSSNEEYRTVLGVVSKYAIHYGDNGVGFTCKNLNASNRNKMADVHTTSKNSSLDNIRSIYGSKVAKELLNFDIEETLDPLSTTRASTTTTIMANTGFKFKAKGYISNANWSSKTGNFILFINHRLVEHPPLKRAINSVYTEYLPRHGKPFIYLSLELPPHEVDVNVHPTKKEVIFSRSDEIVGDICISLREKLKGGNQSRVFQTMNPSTMFAPVSTSSSSSSSTSSKSKNSTIGTKKNSSASTISNSASLSTTNNMTSKQGNTKENHPNSKIGPTASSIRKNDPSDDSDFATSLESFKRKSNFLTRSISSSSSSSRSSSSDGSSAGNGAFIMPLSKPKKKPKAYDPKRLNRTDYSNPSGRLDNFLTKTKKNVKKINDNNNNNTNAIPGTKNNDKRKHDEINSTITTTTTTTTRTTATNAMTMANDQSLQSRNLNFITKTYPHPNNIKRKKRRKNNDVSNNNSSNNNSSYSSADGDSDDSDSDELTSILNMRKDIELEYHKGLATVLKKHVFVGIVDNDYSLIQYETKLFMLNHTVLAEEYFYQTVIYNFSHFYKLKIPSKPNIKDLISIGLDMNDMKVVTMTQEGNIPKHKRVETAVSKLMNHNRRAMLEDYFSIEIDDEGCLCMLPDLLPGYVPLEMALPVFVASLGTRVDFNDERTCFEDVAQCLARYFCSLPFKKEAKGNGSGSSDGNATNSKRNNNNNNNEEDDNDDRKTLKWFIQHILLPSCRSRYYPRREFATDGTILQIAALEDLYRQFER